jgi:hypothetical protein
MPSFVHGAKVSEGARNKRLIFTGIVLAVLLGVLVSFLAMLAISHKYGLRELQMDWATRTTLGVYENVQRLMDGCTG